MDTITLTDGSASCNEIARLTDRQALKQYEKMVFKFARAFSRAYVSFGIAADDLVAEGMLAVVEANRALDPAKGSLSTIVYGYIRGRMLRFCRSNIAIVRTTHRTGARACDVVSTAATIGSEDGTATIGDLLADATSLAAIAEHDNSGTLEKILAMIDLADRTEDYSECQRRIRERQRAILTDMIMVADKSLAATPEELAVRFGCTKQSIHNAEDKLVERIRDMLGIELKRSAA